MLEHDPHWEKSLEKMAEILNPNGALFLSWGAALNNPHDLSTAPDGLFHSLPAGKVIDKLASLGFVIHQFRYEYRMPWLEAPERKKIDYGCVGLAASIGPLLDGVRDWFDPLLPEDRA